MDAKAFIEHNEGRRYKLYKCPAEKWTIGVGFNLEDVGLFDSEIDFILNNRIEILKRNLKKNVPFWERLNEARQIVLIDMCFNLGWPRLSKFEDMFKALAKEDYVQASREILDSEYAKQVKNRAERNAEIMEKGSL